MQQKELIRDGFAAVLGEKLFSLFSPGWMNKKRYLRIATAHLNDEELALYADSVILNLQDQLPEQVLHHVMECADCKKELMELLYLIEAQVPYIYSETHPHFGHTIV